MTNNRDDFSALTKKTLAERVGWRCSYPECNQDTVGPSHASIGVSINNGIAAHICAAAPNGPRYNPHMTVDERKSIENGIWMCRNHANLIDTDYITYSVEQISQWKLAAEKAQYLRLANAVINQPPRYSDRDLRVLNDYCNVLDFNTITLISNELFGSRVSHAVTAPLDEIESYGGNPTYEFTDPELENIRKQLHTDIANFYQHFSKNSAGNIGYYEYININEFLARNPSTSSNYWLQQIDITQRLAQQVCKSAMLLFNIRAKQN